MYYSYSDRRKQEWHIDVQDEKLKKESLNALFNILEYWEEPYLCRRKMQLKYLNEKFSSKSWNSTWDNWQRVENSGGELVEENYTKEAKIIVYFVDRYTKKGKKSEWTILQLAEALQGRNSKKINKFLDLKSDFHGRLKHIDENLIRRICIKLLRLEILKEKINMLTFNDGASTSATYITVGENIDQFKRGKIKIFLTNIAYNPEKTKEIKQKKLDEEKQRKEKEYQQFKERNDKLREQRINARKRKERLNEISEYPKRTKINEEDNNSEEEEYNDKIGLQG